MFQIIIPILTLFLSGVVAAYVTYSLNRKKEYLLFMQQKAEELYVAAEKYHKLLAGYFFLYRPLLENEITYNQLLDLQIKNADVTSKDEHIKVRMLTSFYFSHIEKLFDVVNERRTDLNRLLKDHKKAYKENRADDGKWLEKYVVQVKLILQASKDFESAIIAEGRKLAASKDSWSSFGFPKLIFFKSRTRAS